MCIYYNFQVDLLIFSVHSPEFEESINNRDFLRSDARIAILSVASVLPVITGEKTGNVCNKR